MGKCLSINPSQKYDRIALDDYIQNLKQAKSVRRSTIILFQEISNLADMKLVTRAKIKDNKVKKEKVKMKSSRFTSKGTPSAKNAVLNLRFFYMNIKMNSNVQYRF